MLHRLKALCPKNNRTYISIVDILRNRTSVIPTENIQDRVKNYYVDGKYVFRHSLETEKSLGSVVKWLLSRKSGNLKLRNVESYPKLFRVVKMDTKSLLAISQPNLTWIGHATCYVRMSGFSILTDPVWSERASPSQYFGPARLIDPPFQLDDLTVDIVLLSHTHYDHLDMHTARRIGNRALWVVPLGVGKILRKEAAIENFVELDWWQSHTISSSDATHKIEVTFAPTKHWTARTLFDRNTHLWGSFAVTAHRFTPDTHEGLRTKPVDSLRTAHRFTPDTHEGLRIKPVDSLRFFFGGDTGYCPQIFQSIGRDLGPFDFAALPIGAYRPKWFLGSVHIDPEEALQVHQHIRSKQSVAIHWGTFHLADEDYLEPPLELGRARKSRGISMREFFTMMHGETWVVGEEPKNDFSATHPDLLAQYEDIRRDPAFDSP